MSSMQSVLPTRLLQAVLPMLAVGALCLPSCSTDNDNSLGTGVGHHDPGHGGDAGTDVWIGLDATAPDTSDEPEVCGGTFAKASLVPLDLYVMLDRSESMLLPTSAGVSKWKATSDALQAFAEDKTLQHVNLALQFFPFFHPGVPAACSNDGECKGYGPCLQPSICSNHWGNGKIVVCHTDDDCTVGNDTGQCFPRGTCSNDHDKVCLPEFQQACRGNLGDCVKVPAYCAERRSCQAADYAKPALPMQPRSSFASKLKASLQAHAPSGMTPTGPALQGALDYAHDFLGSHPKERPIVVLVTDGLPTDCSPTSIQDIAKIAAKRYPEILTFVVGVFDDEMAKQAKSNLDEIAKAGGTGQAIIIKTSTDVAKELSKALQSIQKMAVDCTYAIPQPTEGEFEADLVNVYIQEGGKSRTVPYVESKAHCGGGHEGWYYDHDPAKGETPTRILLCSDTCDAIQGKESLTVLIQLGCPTEGIK